MLVVVTFVRVSIRIRFYYIGSSDGVFFLQFEVLFFSFSVSNISVSYVSYCFSCLEISDHLSS